MSTISLPIVPVFSINNFSCFEIEQAAKTHLQKEIYDFIAGGALDEATMSTNINAFNSINFIPRVLTGHLTCDLSTSVLGKPLSLPLLIAPMALNCIVHPEGELAVARAAQQEGIINISSTMASYSFEEVLRKTKCPSWFQLYLFKDKGITHSLIQMAEKSGAMGLVVTVDMPVMGTRRRDMQNKFSFSNNIVPGNLVNFTKNLTVKEFTDKHFKNSASWDDIACIKKQTSLPIILKGILHYQDVILAQEHSINSVILSNHGGRQLDHAISSIGALNIIKQRINVTLPLIVDSGIRSGTDIAKAIALGADAVTIGRPILWGLATNGELGVRGIIRKLKHELTETMMLLGCHNIEALKTKAELVINGHL